MSDGADYLDAVKAQLESGRNAWRRADNVFRAFGYVRRRQTAVDLIHKELAARGMFPEPSLSTSIPHSTFVRFSLGKPPTKAVAAAVETTEPVAVPLPPKSEQVDEAPIADESNPADRALIVGNLEAAENNPVMVPPQASLGEALTMMDLRDYSQLAVGSHYNSVKGLVSYKSIARAQLLGNPKTAGDALDPSVPRVEPNAPLLDVIGMFGKHDAVLVQGADKVVRGIVTPADIAEEFSALAGPFLLIGQIEEQLRWLVKRWLERDKVDLAAALKLEAHDGKGPAAPKQITDLTMGELHWILSAEDNWLAIGIKYERVTFCKEFDAVREIRNAVMHFKDGPGPAEHKRVQDFAAVVQRAYLARK